MKEFIIITLLLACSTSIALGQVFSGHVYNKDQKPATECNILAIDPASGEVLQFTTPNAQGYYELKLSAIKTSSIYLRCQGLIYQTQTIEIVLNAQKNTYNQDFFLENSQFNLNEVIIISQKPKIVINNDTVSFDATKFAQEQDVKVIDLLKRLPGIEVNDKSGHSFRHRINLVDSGLIVGDLFFRITFAYKRDYPFISFFNIRVKQERANYRLYCECSFALLCFVKFCVLSCLLGGAVGMH